MSKEAYEAYMVTQFKQNAAALLADACRSSSVARYETGCPFGMPGFKCEFNTGGCDRMQPLDWLDYLEKRKSTWDWAGEGLTNASTRPMVTNTGANCPGQCAQDDDVPVIGTSPD